MAKPTQSFLPQDIIEDILTRLPVKALLRFKCLSKHYCSLFDTHRFISTHLKHSIKNPSILALSLGKIFKLSPAGRSSFHSSNEAIRRTDHVFTTYIDSRNRPLPPENVVGSCHGLVCYVYFETETNMQSVQCVVSYVGLWNPATRKSKFLTKYINPSEFFTGNGLGFGFDPNVNDYKFVRTSIDSKSIQFNVFERNKSCWRQINYVRHPEIRMRSDIRSKAVAVQGALYWNVDNHMLISFSLLDDSIHWISFPPPLDRSTKMTTTMTANYFSSSRGVIFCAWKESVAALVYETYLYPGKHFDIWVLNAGIEGKDRGWYKMFTITPLKFRLLKPLCIWRDQEAVFELMNDKLKDKLFGLDINGEAAEPRLLFHETNQKRISSVCNYEESLASV